MESAADDFATCAEPAAPRPHSPEGNTHLNSGTQVFTLGKNWISPFQVKIRGNYEELKPVTNLSLLGFIKTFMHCQPRGFSCSFKAN